MTPRQSTVDPGPSLLSSGVHEHDDGGWSEGHRYNLPGHDMMSVCQEARLALVPDWPCPYCLTVVIVA
jgi:hypothetical protein